MFVARDMFIGDKRSLTVSLFSLYKVVDTKGGQYDHGERLRWLGESILYPTNLLPSDRVQWTAIDAHTTKLTFSYNGLSLFFIIAFNEIGETTQWKRNATWMRKILKPGLSK